MAAGLAVSDRVARGVAVMATGAWYTPDADGEDPGAANTLTLDIGTSDLTQGRNAMSCLVEVSREP
ncbi:molybdopterin dinucleotide binding domain-containing protein [Cupriavidus sp. CV2]|uniref:molybdopterin dinucleotide binding domain-containing protein n=1 Tax=Cupriavidus ulmosensis TaxID=3065913 RepID=UPI00296B2754|nr:molybdopterin dinucleotide binding domain-containing protein [Cupriavidus sp. CV2]MDW3688743.1 molybdopterin dinucleotide binding domain-containing protein [Cupriavidus sp. CV2]